MKFLFINILFISSICLSEQVFYNSLGFPSCYEKNDKVYFLNWDQISSAQTKNVSYFEKTEYIQSTGHFINGCSDEKYIHDVPSEILRSVENDVELFPVNIVSAAAQIKNGAHVYRIENTASEFILNHTDLFHADSPNQIENLRNSYGDQFALDLMSVWSKKIIRSENSCEQYIGTCDFYLCQEQKNPCGLDGYNLGFGFKYCSRSRFKLFDQMKTQSGKNWVTNVFQCLQRQSFLKSQSAQARTCDQIKTDAYDSHPDCYAAAGFCDLNFAEKLKIIQLIKNEILSSDTIEQAVLLLQKCGSSVNDQKILNHQHVSKGSK